MQVSGIIKNSIKIIFNDIKIYLCYYYYFKKAIETGNLDKLFFSKNIMESCNEKLNDSIIKDKNNTINNFNNKINYIINLYKTAKNYKNPIFSKTKALATI